MADGAKKFDPKTRTSIQKRIEKQIKDSKQSINGLVKKMVEAEFEKTLKKGDEKDEERFVRALMVLVGQACFDAGVQLSHIGYGAAGVGHSLRNDLKEAGKLPETKAEKKSKFTVIDGGPETEEEDEENDEEADENDE